MPNDDPKIIKDPIHGAIRVSSSFAKLLKPIVDHPHFQRLRQIKQLGLAELIFPGAVHNRFTHSIGCAHIARKILNSLKEDPKKHKAVLVAALLHDIGHGPFSHAFEEISKIAHENWGPFFIKDMASEMRGEYIKLFKDVKKNFKKKEDGGTEKPPRYKEIISSQMDADRMDYLLRDSHFCGVTYGRYELDWLLNSIVPDSPGNGKVMISWKGVGAVEQFLFARRLMQKYVYFHPKVQAAEFLFQKFLEQLKESPNKQLIGTNLFNFLQALEKYNKKPENKNKTKEERIPDKDLFIPYSKLTDIDIWQTLRNYSERTNSDASEIASRLVERKFPEIYTLDPSCINSVKDEVEKVKRVKSWQFSIIEKPITLYKENTDPITVVGENGSSKTIDHYSEFTHILGDKKETIGWLLVDAELKNKEAEKLIKKFEKLGYIAK